MSCHAGKHLLAPRPPPPPPTLSSHTLGVEVDQEGEGGFARLRDLLTHMLLARLLITVFPSHQHLNHHHGVGTRPRLG